MRLQQLGYAGPRISTLASLKLLAFFLMTADHLWKLLPVYQQWLPVEATHALGRLAAPIFCWILASHYAMHYQLHNKPIWNYSKRLLLFWLLSIPVLALHFVAYLNIFFVLLVGLGFLDCYARRQVWKIGAGCLVLMSCNARLWSPEILATMLYPTLFFAILVDRRSVLWSLPVFGLATVETAGFMHGLSTLWILISCSTTIAALSALLACPFTVRNSMTQAYPVGLSGYAYYPAHLAVLSLLQTGFRSLVHS